ncbi:ABC transporter ATP-binding protein [Heyndrickxia coagulans]|uniref:ABC transporter related protein n=1 Tax=Heyndrickxia coagulans 36D1 TaxID=345219 RepID=G2TIT1_HEYCO|nr:ABC transporter ATP-binding protein [Heyndrickxia coagulans]AEP00554.1 ABC transporter related protein [Heyndrickxia coagulans 36D1]
MNDNNNGSSLSFVDIIKTTKPSKILFFSASVLSLLGCVISLTVPLLIERLIDQLKSNIDIKLIVWIIAFSLLESVASSISQFLLSVSAEKVIFNLREALWNKTLQLPMKYYQKNKSEELVSRLTNDTTTVASIVTDEMVDLISSFFTLCVSIVILLFLDIPMTLALIIVVPLSLFIIIPFGKRFGEIAYKSQDRISELTMFSSQILRNIKIVKSFGAETKELQSGKDKFYSLYKLGVKSSILNAVIGPFLGTFGFLLLISVVGLGALRVSNGDISIGKLVAFIIYLFQVIAPFININMFFTSYQEAKGSLKRIFEILNEDVEPDHFLTNSVKNKNSFNTLILSHITFSYHEEQVLKDISFHVNKGEIVALIGESGAGKSTIFNLIERFYEPQSGEMYLDHVSFREVEPGLWRQSFSYVPQDSQLFDGTVKDNITYGLSSVTEEEIVHAAKLANAHDFILALPDGYGSEIGEYGNRLSSGQKQRIAIARAFLRKPDFILMDESTANLDSESEYLLQDSLKHLSEHVGVILIAHRLSTIMNTDRILVLENGKITGDGSHETLYQTNAYYRNLIQHQGLNKNQA